MLKYKQIWYGIKPIRWLIKFNLTEQSCQLEHYRTKQDNWPYGYLATGSRDLVKSRDQAASQPCFEKPDVSHSPLTSV